MKIKGVYTMKHFIFFFHILSFLTGFTVVILSILTYMKYRHQVIKEYIIFLMALTTILLEQTITSYNLINIVQFTTLNIILNIVSYVAAAMIIYFLPLFTYEMMGKEWTTKERRIFQYISVLPLLGIIIYYITPYKNLINIVLSSTLFLVILYCLIFIYFNYKTIVNKYKKRILKVLLLSTVLFFPYMYLDTKTEQISFLNQWFPYGLLSLPLFYMVWNLLSIYLIAKYFKQDIRMKVNSSEEQEEEYDNFFAKFSITNREQEIILLLIKGYTYNQLAEELSISLATVKTHVHNIYTKTEVKNKFQLLKLMNERKIE